MTQTADEREEQKEQMAQHVGGLPTGVKSSYKVDMIAERPEAATSFK